MSIFDMLLSNAMMGEGGGGGGGSSDFSTAQVTIINNVSRQNADVINVFIAEGYEGLVTQAEILTGTSTITAVLYKNHGELYIDGYDGSAEATDDISYEGDGSFIISGNGTITLSQ